VPVGQQLTGTADEQPVRGHGQHTVRALLRQARAAWAMVLPVLIRSST